MAPSDLTHHQGCGACTLGVSAFAVHFVFNAESFCWTASFSDVMAGKGPVPLPLLWRLMLLSDGSTTRHLQLVTGEECEVDLITMQPETSLSPQCPDGVQDLRGPYLRRRIWKRCGGQTVLWAESWWNQHTAEAHFHEPHTTLWHNLRRDPVELRREIDQLGQVQHQQFAERFGRVGPFWTRSYRFFKGGRVLTVIREVFSPVLDGFPDGEPPAEPGKR